MKYPENDNTCIFWGDPQKQSSYVAIRKHMYILGTLEKEEHDMLTSREKDPSSEEDDLHAEK
jgi:hypothetical protein